MAQAPQAGNAGCRPADSPELIGAFPTRPFGILCRKPGQECAWRAPVATALAFLDRSPGTPIATRFRRWHDVGHKDGASTKKFAGPRQFSGNACGVLDSGVPIGALESDTVRKQAVSVDDVKEVSHPTRLGQIRSGFQ
jgi:hypothetical protein